MSDPRTLLPPSATALSRSIETVMAERTQGIEAPIGTLWHVDTCPVDLLPWLAWAFSVEVWDHAWPEEIKRNVIRDAVKVHRLKGTRRSVELALEALKMRIDLHEGFELDELGRAYGPAFTFTLDAFADDIFDAGYQINAELHALVTRLIENVKPVRAHFTLRIGEKKGGTVTLRTGSLQRAEDHRHITPALPVDTHAPQISARTGHRGRAISREIHRFDMGDAA